MRDDPYYSAEVLVEVEPYLHLEPYLRCWLDPEKLFIGKYVLDVGSGECTYTRLIAEKFRPKAIVASDLRPKRMLPTIRVNRNPLLKFVAADCLALPFRDGAFDVVWCNGVLCELPNHEQAVLEIRRVLKNGGVYAGWEPNPFNPVNLYRYFFKPHPAHHRLFWWWRVRRIFETSGFHVMIRFFYAKLPSVRNRFLATCIGIIAQKTCYELHSA